MFIYIMLDSDQTSATDILLSVNALLVQVQCVLFHLWKPLNNSEYFPQIKKSLTRLLTVSEGTVGLPNILN